MDIQSLQDKAFEILKMKYSEHVKELRFRNTFDLTLLLGFVVLNLVFAAWLSHNAPDPSAKKPLIALVASLCLSTFMSFHRNNRHRKFIIKILHNINTVFKFSEKEIYFEGQINPPENQKMTHWGTYYAYILVIIICFIAQTIMIIGAETQLSIPYLRTF